MTTNSQALATTPTWHITDYRDFNEVDADLSGLRFTQGIVWNPDANEWISTWQMGMARLTPDFVFLQKTGSYDLSTFEPISAIPEALANMGLDHIGDIDYANGKLYVALDNSELDYTTGYVAVFNASDLSYTGQLFALNGAPSNVHDDVASWVAVDADAGLGYGKEYKSGNTINVYNLTDWSFKETITMDMNLDHIQGAKVLDGMMYMSSDNSTGSVYSLNMSTGHVEELFQLPIPANVDTEVEGIEARKNADGNVELTVELIIEPDGDSVADDYVRVFTYTLDGTSAVEPHHTWTVNNNGDTSNANDLKLTLREAIAKAEAGDTITFDSSLSGQTITLGDAELALSKDIAIEGDLNGDGKSDITITRASASAAIHVAAGSTVTFDGLVVTHSDDTALSSITVDAGATLVFGNGATMATGTDAAETMNGTVHWDVIRGGAGNDTILGLGGNDELFGEAGNDTLNGGTGTTNTLVGGVGNDTYIVSSETDVVTELKSEGTDLVKAASSYTLSVNVENLTLTGTANSDGTGNTLGNVITGNAGANMLFGGNGYDTLNSGSGDDVVHGDSGNDKINGGAGDDVIVGGAGKDMLTGGAEADRFVFALGDSFASKAKADTILDMHGSQGDRIDLRQIDANEDKSGNQAFHFIGTDHFGGDAGELRYQKIGSETYVYGDTDGDKHADFALHLDGAMSLKADYFLL